MPVLSKQHVQILKIQIQFAGSGPARVSHVSTPTLESQHSCRATRLVDDPTRFLIAKVKEQRNMADCRVEAGIDQIVDQGLRIGDQHFSFLGYTDSQLKAGQLMLFKEGDGWTVDRVLEHCGKLQDVYLKSGYGKYSARLGLSFSATVEGPNVPLERALRIDDLKAIDGSVTTDGCGMICETFARQLCAQLGIPEDTLSQYFKSVEEALKDYCSSILPWIAYRPSMVKYEGGPTHIEVSNVSGSTAARTCLNQQFISLLLTLGISVEVFQSLLKQHLERIQSLATDRERAISFLCGSAAELDSRSMGLAQELLEMLYGHHEMDEPVLASRIRKFQNLQYKNLRDKFRIDVPDSCWLYGVVDELGVLKENEVYINLSRSGVQCRKMVVGRSPAYSPGDMRVLQGVDCLELSHMKDCIGFNFQFHEAYYPFSLFACFPQVFSKQCFRSIPDTMGGGDLDGDRYWVCSDPRLIPDRTEAPEERPQPAPKMVVTRSLTDMKKDASRIFVKLRGSYLLGTMSNAWVKAVEVNTTHLANDHYARSLVPLLEAAMDMTKSGDDVNLLQQKFNSLDRPQTQGRDQTGPFDVLRKDIPKEHTQKPNFKLDPDLATPEYDEPRWKEHYEMGRHVMKEFNIELFEGVKRDDIASELKEGEKVEKQANLVKQRFVEQYFSGHPGKQDDERLRASAWYALGYREKKEAFAWLGARYLHRIKAEKVQGRGLVMSIGPRKKSPAANNETAQPAREPVTPFRGDTPGTDRGSSDTPLEDIGNCPEVGEETFRLNNPMDSPTSYPVTVRATRARGPRETVARGAGRVSQLFAQAPLDVRMDKPTYPVATPGIPACSGHEHAWGVRAGSTWRHYTCQVCSCIVKEKRRDGIWIPNEVSGGLLESRIDVDGDARVNPGPAEAAPHRNPGRLLPPPVHHSCDVTTDKPTYPVATPTIPACSLTEHIWGRKAGGTWRHYTCNACQCLVKEKRRGGIWCPDAVL